MKAAVLILALALPGCAFVDTLNALKVQHMEDRRAYFWKERAETRQVQRDQRAEMREWLDGRAERATYPYHTHHPQGFIQDGGDPRACSPNGFGWVDCVHLNRR